MLIQKRLIKNGKTIALVGALLIAESLWGVDDEGPWVKIAIEKWSGYGVVKGMENGDFKPNDWIKRSELATFITRPFQYKKSVLPNMYTDVATGAWYSNAIGSIAERGV